MTIQEVSHRGHKVLWLDALVGGIPGFANLQQRRRGHAPIITAVNLVEIPAAISAKAGDAEYRRRWDRLNNVIGRFVK